MVTLTKALDLQSAPITDTPADRARQAVAKLDHAELIKRFESAGFDVKTMPSEKYGTLIDIISWE